jgi:uncharacterized membrane protein
MKSILVALAAGLCWGIGEVFTKSVLHSGRIGPLTALAVRSTVALPLIWLAYLAAGSVLRAEPRNWLAAPPPVMAKLVLGSGLLAGAAGMTFFYTALSLGEISRVKPVAFTAAPATAALLGMLMLGEPVTARKLAGIACLLAGVVLLTR